ncbi:hypothetical protein SELMODRAFT_437650 [Selaginella moellendorffii]|uniref:Cytochrome c oxidase subunit 5C n=1 Tax=Selaginella moellendorffii TaxID=88036 RepID=D8QNM5_SELML|nr:uncharacterized protein LOC9660268 [Selaginella moellendorffii]EFJ29324.1 hypothetical protein SELMODRAFT_410175 [Selaginella moellendorffii]EFJ38132.1 hypothetical protein SELMODRAFT_437650 [Selaginella moellendorffii]|eukprot:XP_002969236.1 uncharacterized protein LOC9660268 [Selaginella moellendorffii]
MASPQPKPPARPQHGPAAAVPPPKKPDDFAGRRISPKIAAARAAAEAFHKKHSPNVLRELTIGLALGFAGGALWKIYHLNWRRHCEEFYVGLDKGIYTTVVRPKTKLAVEA